MTWTIIDGTNSSNTIATSLVVRAIYDVCTPNWLKTGSLTGSPYTYLIGSADFDLTIPLITNGDCLTWSTVHVNDALSSATTGF